MKAPNLHTRLATAAGATLMAVASLASAQGSAPSASTEKPVARCQLIVMTRVGVSPSFHAESEELTIMGPLSPFRSSAPIELKGFVFQVNEEALCPAHHVACDTFNLRTVLSFGSISSEAVWPISQMSDASIAEAKLKMQDLEAIATCHL